MARTRLYRDGVLDLEDFPTQDLSSSRFGTPLRSSAVGPNTGGPGPEFRRRYSLTGSRGRSRIPIHAKDTGI